MIEKRSMNTMVIAFCECPKNWMAEIWYFHSTVCYVRRWAYHLISSTCTSASFPRIHQCRDHFFVHFNCMSSFTASSLPLSGSNEFPDDELSSLLSRTSVSSHQSLPSSKIADIKREQSSMHFRTIFHKTSVALKFHKYGARSYNMKPVSYTHLTLPTILLV